VNIILSSAVSAFQQLGSRGTEGIFPRIKKNPLFIDEKEYFREKSVMLEHQRR
jgi:hypothetical protein